MEDEVEGGEAPPEEAVDAVAEVAGGGSKMKGLLLRLPRPAHSCTALRENWS